MLYIWIKFNRFKIWKIRISNRYLNWPQIYYHWQKQTLHILPFCPWKMSPRILIHLAKCILLFHGDDLCRMFLCMSVKKKKSYHLFILWCSVKQFFHILKLGGSACIKDKPSLTLKWLANLDLLNKKDFVYSPLVVFEERFNLTGQWCYKIVVFHLWSCFVTVLHHALSSRNLRVSIFSLTTNDTVFTI